MFKSIIITISLLSLIACNTSSTTPKKAPKKAVKNVNWQKINQDVLHDVRAKKGNELDGLVSWVVVEVKSKTPKEKDWDKINNHVLSQYHVKNQSKEYDELISWVIDEVKTKIESDKYILSPEDLKDKEDRLGH